MITKLTFEDRYWHENAGINFTQSYMSDPFRRLQYLDTYNTEMLKLYDRLKIAKPYPPQPVNPMVFGYSVATVPMILGCNVVFFDEKEPYAEPLNLSDEEVMKLVPQEDFSDNPVALDLEKQAEWLKEKYGKACIHINYQSAPNIALKLRGEQLMIDFFENPEIARHVLEYSRLSLINLRKWFDNVNRRNNFPSDSRMFTIDNCTVAFLSPTIYRDFILPGDVRSAEMFKDNFGLHHCGANMHVFSKDYGTMPGSRWYDIGYGSNITQCMEDFKHRAENAVIHARYGPAKLLQADAGEIIQELDAMSNTGAAAIYCVSADASTPDRNIKAYLEWDTIPESHSGPTRQSQQ